MSEGFSKQWLSLREPADHAARSAELTNRLVCWAAGRSPLCVLEFGTGTGSNLRYLCPLLGHDQHWLLLDNDTALLNELPGILRDWAQENGYRFQRKQQAGMLSGTTERDTITLANETFSATVQWQQQDLANDLDSLPFAAADLVTGSALLDLTSETWLSRLATSCIANRCASCFVLNYDGQIDWQPALAEDPQLRSLLNAHQRGDKGFGQAMGPDAGACLAEQLRREHVVHVDTSPWQLTANQASLQSALIQGWAGAAAEQDPHRQTDIGRWLAAHQSFIDAASSRLTVGHIDVLSIPCD